jgi:hypothetical protein
VSARRRPGGQFHLDPSTYLEAIRADVPRYDELQEETIAAIPFEPRRVLELGQKRELFRRVREQARALVIGDVVRADIQIASLEPGVDFPDPAADLAAWSDGEVTWEADDLAVIRARHG